MFLAPVTLAHDARPAHLEIVEVLTGQLEIDWTRPVRNGRALDIHPVFPQKCNLKGLHRAFQLQGVLHESWQLDCGTDELSGEEITVSGLHNVISDVLLRFRDYRGKEHIRILDNQEPVFTVSAENSTVLNIISYYFRLGVMHILTGSDHLLFVLGLLLLIQGFWRLIKTITAFTLAHSVTLAAAILGYVHVPSTPVEAVIALSIVFLACELLRRNPDSMTLKTPWLIAAVFGLVHGLGFAGGLTEIGLPEREIPMALLMFNLGVEVGQLSFIMIVVCLLSILRWVKLEWDPILEKATSYAIGSIGALWLIERVSNFY